MIPVDDSYVQKERNVLPNPGSLARRFAYAAFALWLLSLPFVGIALYGRDEGMRGLYILLIGWLSPLVMNFAWFANVFFIYAFLQILKGSSATKSSILACLIALDTFRLSRVLLDEGGGTAPVYGYGWGAVLWFLALNLIFIAAGIRIRELNVASKGKTSFGWLIKPFGILVLIFGLCTSLGLAAYDHIKGNNQERKKLAGLAFKRYAVCSMPDPQVKRTNVAFSGVLEFAPEKINGDIHSADLSVEKLLSWGIPVVRVFDYDYSLFLSGDSSLIVSTPAKGSPSAILSVEETKGKVSDIVLTLYDFANKKLVFKEKWREEIEHSYTYCPSYGWSGGWVQPRKLLSDALGLKEMQIDLYVNSDRNLKRYQATLMGELKSGETLNDILRKNRQEKSMGDMEAIQKANNLNCPDGVYVPAGYGGNASLLGLRGGRFNIGEQVFHGVSGAKSICTSDSVFLYSGARLGDGKLQLYIYRRSLPDFQPMWMRTVTLDVSLTKTNGSDLRLVSIDEDSGKLFFELIDDLSGLTGKFQAELE